MKKRKILLSMLVLLPMLLLFYSKTVKASYVNRTTTPTELRGNWYSYDQSSKNHKSFYKLRITKHAVNGNGYIVSKNGKKYKKLHVWVFDADYNGGPIYNFQKKYTPSAASLNGGYWLTNKKVHGKRVLAAYLHQDLYHIYTRDKIKHDYSFVNRKNSHLIGSTNKIKKYIK